MRTFRKVRFVGAKGATAGLVLDDSHFVDSSGLGVFPANISAISRLYPISEAGKMERFQQSPPFETWQAAFDFQFSE